MTADVSSVARKLDIDTNVSLTEARDVVLDTDDEEELKCKCPDIELVLGANLSAGSGVLHLTTRRVVWVPGSQASGPALAMRYRQLMVHAISRDPASYPRPCIYLILDKGSEDMMDGEEDSNEDEGEEVAAEVRLIPAEESKIDEIFKVLCECAELNPDSEVEGEGDFFFDEAEVMAGLDPQTRAAVMAERLEGAMDLGEDGEGQEAVENGAREDFEQLVGDDPSRFEDEEDEEEQEPNGAR
ncbi:hypothetical protein VOLCADRAFT_120923 [Volvox carteri f. nagariensis]|uniref:Chloride conductance regulatory protein ICln n=1 Tax=Volvox carteri f. nagariensis TaxID=3068 RepID=D8TWT3_VOLCA|nr:uncharacterized protein VOLCADRAFT_120923 [Volvox carteri f. nagariensis]EFJ48103.1 hypothetical protein VOLCADRAFT_120923 [Volvox carteri f. nagariensis]|eukprot:XP_002950788.1 hypothetical protein VOLCADRAFT_120923 [Volvox carteri f. nagariensis]